MVRRAVALALAGTMAAGITVAIRIARIDAHAPITGRPYVSDLPDPSSRLGRFLSSGDGQFYEALALDPTLSRPASFSSRREAAYRAQRPLLSFLAWASSLGRRGATGWALVVASVLSAGFAAGACASLSLRRSGSAITGGIVLLMPGSLAVLGGLGSELLALGLVALALQAWTDERFWRASVLFVLAAFARETTLVVPGTLALIELVRSRRVGCMSAVAVPFVAWGAWLAWIRWRIGVFPGAQGRIAAPFAGFVRAVPHWQNTVPNLVAIALGAAVVVGLAIKRRDDLLGVVALAHLSLAVVAGPDVWHAWENFTRPLLPLYALGLVALASQHDSLAPTDRPAVAVA